MALGRPTEYDPAFCERVIKLGADGASKREMAAELGISHDTFHRWMNERQDFSDAVKEAMHISQAWWEKQGRIATFGGHDGFNATSYIFQMKNRFRDEWNDTVRQDVSGGLSINVIDRFGNDTE